LIPLSIGEAAAWEAGLAWVTRDQECRFGHHLEWRDPHTDSRSPVRGRSMEDRLAVVRSLIGALTRDEITTQQQEDEEDKKEKTLQAEIGRLDWQISRARTNLTNSIGSGAGPMAGLGLDVTHFKTAAATRYAIKQRMSFAGSKLRLLKYQSASRKRTKRCPTCVRNCRKRGRV
jgi:hypothetical protein